jgi:phage tail-like protein
VNWLVPRSPGELGQEVPGDYRPLQDVVRIGYPVREARAYIARHLGNITSYRLVEARRGEKVGCIREIEIQPWGGGETLWVRVLRSLPDGSPATYFAPEDLVTVTAVVEGSGDAPLQALGPRDRLVLHVPVRSYLRFLPGIYQGAAPTRRRDVARADERSMRQWGARDQVATTQVQLHHADQFRRFLFIFQHMMTTVTEKIDNISSLTDPMLADPRFLPWIASWVSFELDESLPLHQQRELVRRSIRLYRTRGTRAGVEEMIQVLTSAPVEVVERRRPGRTVLGALTLAGGKSVEDRYLRDEPSAFYLQKPDRAATTFFAVRLEDRVTFRRRFGERATAVLRRIAQIVTNEKPAHVTFTIEFEERVR